MTTVNDFVDILRIIREQPEWGDALRSALLSKELLEMPQTLAEFAKVTDGRLGRLEEGQTRLEGRQERLEEGQARLEGRQERLEEGQARLEGRQARLEGAVGNLRGAAYEQKVANNIATIVRHPLGLRRVRLLKGYGATEVMAFHDLMDAAEDRGSITGQERVEAGSADIVIRGERHPSQSTIFVAVETSVTAADSDINRAATRADILAAITGGEAVPVVVYANIDVDRQQLAEEKSVTLIGFGE